MSRFGPPGPPGPSGETLPLITAQLGGDINLEGQSVIPFPLSLYAFGDITTQVGEGAGFVIGVAGTYLFEWSITSSVDGDAEIGI